LYEVVEIAFADAPRSLRYKLDDAFGAGFDLKGFDYPWIIHSRTWRDSDKVLDVGAGYSMLPIHLADHYGCEVWAVDDFGSSSEEEFWKRNKEPQEHIKKHPQVRFAVERLGAINDSSLPQEYFDCIYSASTLEHVPEHLADQVWRHMHHLLKPGGEMVHAVDMKFPSNRGLFSFLKATMLDVFGFILPKSYRTTNLYYTPKTYLARVGSAIGTRIAVRKWNVGALRMVLDPGIVIEPLDWAYNRVVKDRLTDVPFLRVTSLLIHLKKKT
jgi:2-polyprenyl-3-methyl-5-hydroxy-6-metoxy-1,4-benzoquinol methylase